MTEAENALFIAERVLDRPYADPDDDLAILARQTKRAAELRAENARLAAEVADLRRILCETSPILIGLQGLVKTVEAERDSLRAQLAERDAEIERLISERDALHGRIDEIADELGDETEWTNLNDRGENAAELAASLYAECEQRRAQVAVMREVAAELRGAVATESEDALDLCALAQRLEDAANGSPAPSSPAPGDEPQCTSTWTDPSTFRSWRCRRAVGHASFHTANKETEQDKPFWTDNSAGASDLNAPEPEPEPCFARLNFPKGGA